MSNGELFTQLPTTSAATMQDIICAVQGYTSPSNLGLSVQETLGQVYSLFQSNVILSGAGSPNGAVAGTLNQLYYDTTNDILYVCTVAGSSSTAVWSKSINLIAGTGITIDQGGSIIAISASSTQLSFVNVTSQSSVNMVTNHAYNVNNSGSTVTLTLPAASSFGDIIWVSGLTANNWTIAQGTNQGIVIGNQSSTMGTGGSIVSTSGYESLQLYCSTANLTWKSIALQGTVTIN